VEGRSIPSLRSPCLSILLTHSWCGNRRRRNERWKDNLAAELARLKKVKGQSFDDDGIEQILLEAANQLNDSVLENVLNDIDIEDVLVEAELKAEAETRRRVETAARAKVIVEAWARKRVELKAIAKAKAASGCSPPAQNCALRGSAPAFTPGAAKVSKELPPLAARPGHTKPNSHPSILVRRSNLKPPKAVTWGLVQVKEFSSEASIGIE
jgi:hypothetical protein